MKRRISEDEPIRVPKSYMPLCTRCGERHSSFEPCRAAMAEAEASSVMLAICLCLGGPVLAIVALIAAANWILSKF